MEITAKPTASKGNVKLRDRYQNAWERIDGALEQGFYFEAIAVEESILSNRITSFLYGIKSLTAADLEGRTATRKKRFWSLDQLIKLWRKAKEEGLVLEDSVCLIDRANDWRCRRNRALHELTKSFPGKPPEADLCVFVDDVRETAQLGKRLASDVSNWHKRQKRRDQKTHTLTPTAGI
ncbi:hypothetical protein [Candidatus Binatus sp.]|jgi:hypothetical protein|uniref:hypothetical protein n=1 Tax=Candidatus Binatus sp. TaxID=2811406 RepID=UPI003BED1796